MTFANGVHQQFAYEYSEQSGSSELAEEELAKGRAKMGLANPDALESGQAIRWGKLGPKTICL